VPRNLGIACDEPAALRLSLGRAMDSPVVLAAGGMSMGTLDLVPQILSELGVRWLFHGVQLRPGKPVAYGRGSAGQHVFGLPGNPASAFVCAWLFVRMTVRGLQGFSPDPPATQKATLVCDLKPAKDARPSFVPARVWNDPQRGLLVEPTEWGGSGDPFGLALGNALLVRERPLAASTAGECVTVMITGTD